MKINTADSKKAGQSEEKSAYEVTSKFISELHAVSRPVTDFKDIKSFIYRMYPTFFLSGINLGTHYVIIDQVGELAEAVSNANHYPHQYSQFQLSMFIRYCRRVFKWELDYTQIADIVEYCQGDFTPEFLELFPRVVRVFTSSDGKKEEFSKILEKRPVEFLHFEFVEIQGEVEQIVADKLDQIDIEEIEDQVNVVDDVGLEFYALRGAPGPYIKPFLENVKHDNVSEILHKLGDNRGHIHIGIGLSYTSEGKVEKIVIHARFPIRWFSGQGSGYGFDPYLSYMGRPILDCDRSVLPRQVLMEWLWHRYHRRRRNRI